MTITKKNPRIISVWISYTFKLMPGHANNLRVATHELAHARTNEMTPDFCTVQVVDASSLHVRLAH